MQQKNKRAKSQRRGQKKPLAQTKEQGAETAKTDNSRKEVNKGKAKQQQNRKPRQKTPREIKNQAKNTTLKNTMQQMQTKSNHQTQKNQ